MNMIELFRDWNDVVEYPSKTVIFGERDPADVRCAAFAQHVDSHRQNQLGSGPVPPR